MRDLSAFINSSEMLKDLTGHVFKPCVVILGSFNSGKSTLINSLLGLNISPVGVIPTTSRLIYFDYGSSFRASVYNRHKKEVFLQPEQLYSFLARDVSSGRTEIQVPSPILKKCRLVDTPGIDSPDTDLFKISEQAVKKADKIIYLFHQRGIEESSRLFLLKLASAWKNKNLNNISFWLNCNLGTSDGTSLAATRSALREIFLSPVRLNSINTFAREDLETFYLFLEVELAREYFRRTAGELRKIDAEIPYRVKKAASIKDESLFFSEFWRIEETARMILETGRIIHTIPLFMKELENKLKSMDAENLKGAEKGAGGTAYRPKTLSIRENRKALLNIISLLTKDPVIKNYIDRHRLEELSRQVESERFTVVVAGGFSTGKSTFINALLKDEILPASDGPTTAAITRITHGRSKRAAVYTPLQTTLQVYDLVEDKVELNKAALESLERWMTADVPSISLLEACIDGRFEVVDRREMAGLIKKTRELFAAGTFARTGGATLPSTYRRIPVKKLKGGRAPQKIRVTFKDPGAREFHISEPSVLQAFQDAMGPAHALKIREVEIQHPAEFLELAVLVDTPGLDWIQRHYREKTSSIIKNSDVCLVFLNGKHILSDMDRNNFESIFWLKEPEHAGQKELLEKDEEKIFYVISFADTLTPPQREAVYNYLMSFLSSSPIRAEGKKPKPRVFLISGLKGLTGSESGIRTLLNNLEEVILRHRGRSFYLARLNDLYSIVDTASQKINSEILSGQSLYDQKKFLRAAQKSLREHKSQIKNIRNTIYDCGRIEISGKRETFRRAVEEDYK